MPDLGGLPLPNVGVLYADRAVNSVVKAWDVRENLQAFQQTFQHISWWT